MSEHSEIMRELNGEADPLCLECRSDDCEHAKTTGSGATPVSLVSPAPSPNRFGVDTDYFRREMVKLAGSLDNRPAAELSRYFQVLANIAADIHNGKAPPSLHAQPPAPQPIPPPGVEGGNQALEWPPEALIPAARVFLADAMDYLGTLHPDYDPGRAALKALSPPVLCLADWKEMDVQRQRDKAEVLRLRAQPIPPEAGTT